MSDRTMIPLANLHAAKRTTKVFNECVARLGCEREMFEAVIAVESRARGYDRHGRLVALFEPHVFYRELAKQAPEKLDRAVRAGVAYQKWGWKPYPKDSYPRIEVARRIDEEIAYDSTSWGLPQILGVNAKVSGYQSATDMVTSFLSGEDAHFTAMTQFILSNKLDDDLRAKNFESFARGYNGAGYKRNGYHTALESAYRRAKLRSRTKPVATTAGTTVAGGGGVTANTVNESGSSDGAMLVAGGAVILVVVIAFVASRLGREPAEWRPLGKADAEPNSGESDLKSILGSMRDAYASMTETLADLTRRVTALESRAAAPKAPVLSVGGDHAPNDL